MVRPLPCLVHFPSSHYPKCSSDGRIAAGTHRASWQKARHLAGPEFANSNGLLVLFVRLFVGGLRTARILALLLRAARILALRLRTARILTLLLRAARILALLPRVGRLRGFVGALLWTRHAIPFKKKILSSFRSLDISIGLAIVKQVRSRFYFQSNRFTGQFCSNV